MMKSSRLVPPALLLAFAALVPACGNDGGDESSSTTAAPVDLDEVDGCAIIGDATRPGDGGLYTQDPASVAFWDAYRTEGPEENREHAEVVWRTVAEAGDEDNPAVAWGDGAYITAIGNLATWHTLNC
ncbi:MAG: hypothetical protein ACR2O6_01150 [Ilumatobacteraceae bacterium]